MTICEMSGKVLGKFDEIREFTVKGKPIKVSDAYNQCDRCDSVQLWADEMHWQDTMGDGAYHEHMGDFDAVCDKCFHKLKKDNDIDVAWNEAEEIHSGLNEMTDDEIIECKTALIDRTKAIMSRLHPYASQEREFYYQ